MECTGICWSQLVSTLISQSNRCVSPAAFCDKLWCVATVHFSCSLHGSHACNHTGEHTVFCGISPRSAGCDGLWTQGCWTPSVCVMAWWVYQHHSCSFLWRHRHTRLEKNRSNTRFYKTLCYCVSSVIWFPLQPPLVFHLQLMRLFY